MFFADVQKCTIPCHTVPYGAQAARAIMWLCCYIDDTQIRTHTCFTVLDRMALSYGCVLCDVVMFLV